MTKVVRIDGDIVTDQVRLDSIVVEMKAQAGEVADSASAAVSMPRGEANTWAGGVSRSVARVAEKRSAQRRVWNPQAWWAASEVMSSRRTAGGSTDMPSGPANGVWWKCTSERSGRASRTSGARRVRW